MGKRGKALHTLNKGQLRSAGIKLGIEMPVMATKAQLVELVHAGMEMKGLNIMSLSPSSSKGSFEEPEHLPEQAPLAEKESSASGSGGGGKEGGEEGGKEGGEEQGEGTDGQLLIQPVEHDGSFMLHVKRVDTNTTHNLQVAEEETIAVVKALMQGLIEVPRNDQRLVFGGDMLEDWLTIKDYEIPHAGTVYLHIAGTGGAKRTRIDTRKMTIEAQWQETIIEAQQVALNPLSCQQAKDIYKFMMEMDLMDKNKEDIMQKRLEQVESSKLEKILEIWSAKSGGTTERRMQETMPLWLEPLYTPMEFVVEESGRCMEMLSTALLFAFTKSFFNEVTAKYDVERFKKLVETAMKENSKKELRQQFIKEMESGMKM
jgi:hypothetical protein